jgi:cysteinyl-tRNA synthetase
MLKIYNSLTREKQDFVPIDPGQRPHVRLRHDRLRLLPPWPRPRPGGFRHGAALAAGERLQVTYVRNITDIDDKIIKRAFENKQSIAELTDRVSSAS